MSFSQPYHNIAVFPCATGCRGSASDPRKCLCICRGVNHGSLLENRPLRPFTIYEGQYAPSEEILVHPPSLPLERLALPIYEMTGVKEPKPLTERERGRPRVSFKRKIAKSFFKTMTGHVSTDEKNTRILDGLTKQFGSAFADEAVNEAFSEYFKGETISPNRPELYELLENETLDHAIEKLGKTWVIGRPRI